LGRFLGILLYFNIFIYAKNKNKNYKT